MESSAGQAGQEFSWPWSNYWRIISHCSTGTVFQCCASLWGGIHVCAKYLELAEVEMSLWQAQPRVRWVSFGVIWSEDCLQRQDQHQSHLKIVRNMRESLWCCSCLQIQNPFVCKRCELKFKQSSVLKFHIIAERINLVNPLWDLETVKLDGKIMLRLWWIVWRMAKRYAKDGGLWK